MVLTDSLPSITAVSSLFATSFQRWRNPTWFPQPCVKPGYLMNAPRPATACTSVRVGNASPSETHCCMPCRPTRYFRSSHAAGLFFESFAIEYDTVKARLPRVLSFGNGAVVNFTLGKVAIVGNIQLPSKANAARALPNASPHQLEPVWEGCAAR